MTYYLDANIVSYLLKGNKEIFSKLSDLASNDHTISIPNIVFSIPSIIDIISPVIFPNI